MKNKTKLLFRDAFFSTLLSSTIVLLMVLIFVNLRFFNPIHKAFKDFSFLDVFYAEKFQETTKVSTDIVLVNAGNDRLQAVDLLNRIVEAEPKVIGVDVMFKDRKEIVYIDSMLASLLTNEKIITSFNIKEDIVIKNHPYFITNKEGFVEFNFDDKTAVIREFVGFKEIQAQEQWSFAAQIAKYYLHDKWELYEYDKRLRRAQTVNYIGNYDSFQHLDYDDFRDYEKKKILKDKIVIFGYLGTPIGNENDIEDKFFTPLNEVIAGKSDVDMFGTAIHANIVNMLIKNDFMLTISNTWLAIITFLAMYFSTIYYMKINRKYKVSYRTRKRTFQFLVSIFILILSFWLFKNDVVLKPAIVIVGIILAGSYFKYYKHLTRYFKTKTQKKWKTYLK